MADRIKKVTYCYAKVPSRAGNGAKVLEEIKDADINLLAFSGFPAGKGEFDLGQAACEINAQGDKGKAFLDEFAFEFFDFPTMNK